jgi:hypothetical protein
LHELVPTVTSVAMLVNPGNFGFADADTKEAQQAARALGINLLVANNPREIDAAFAALVQQQARALLISAIWRFKAPHPGLIGPGGVRLPAQP